MADVLSTGLKLFSFSKRRKAKKARAAANDLEERRRKVANAVARRRTMAAARRAQANVYAAALASGNVDGSAARQSASNAQSQADASIGVQTQLEGYDQNRFNYLRQANKKENQAETIDAVGDLYNQASGDIKNMLTGGVG